MPSSSSDSSSFSLRGARRWRKGGKDCHDIRIRLLERVLAALPPTEPTAVIAVPLHRRRIGSKLYHSIAHVCPAFFRYLSPLHYCLHLSSLPFSAALSSRRSNPSPPLSHPRRRRRRRRRPPRLTSGKGRLSLSLSLFLLRLSLSSSFPPFTPSIRPPSPSCCFWPRGQKRRTRGVFSPGFFPALSLSQRPPPPRSAQKGEISASIHPFFPPAILHWTVTQEEGEGGERTHLLGRPFDAGLLLTAKKGEG